MPRADGPFEVVEKINGNAYKIDLPGDYGVSCTFNVADLSPYFANEPLGNLRSNSSQQGEDDAPVVAQVGQQVNHLIQPKEVQQVLVAIGEMQVDAGLFLLNWASKSSHLVTLVA